MDLTDHMDHVDHMDHINRMDHMDHIDHMDHVDHKDRVDQYGSHGSCGSYAGRQIPHPQTKFTVSKNILHLCPQGRKSRKRNADKGTCCPVPQIPAGVGAGPVCPVTEDGGDLVS